MEAANLRIGIARSDCSNAYFNKDLVKFIVKQLG